MIDSLLICFTKNTHVSLSLTTIFNPRHFHFCPNILSLTLLIHYSLSLSPSPFAYSSLDFHLLRFHINTPLFYRLYH